MTAGGGHQSVLDARRDLGGGTSRPPVRRETGGGTGPCVLPADRWGRLRGFPQPQRQPSADDHGSRPGTDAPPPQGAAASVPPALHAATLARRGGLASGVPPCRYGLRGDGPPGSRRRRAGFGLMVRALLALPVAARAVRPHRDPCAQRLVAPDHRLHRLSAGGTDGLFAVHVPRVGPERVQRFLLYVRTSTPLPNERTDSSANCVIAKPESNIGMPEPCTMGYVLMTSSSISSASSPAILAPPHR